ncbi:MAG: YqgE/AlgH family protein [Planctomycetota bacterium]
MKHEVLPGTLLIAGPGLVDPNFRRAVVLVCEHSEEGSMGLVLNRPLNAPLAKVFPQLAKLASADSAAAEETLGNLHCGGPVENGRLLVLSTGAQVGEDDRRVLEGIYLVADVGAVLSDLAAGIVVPSAYRFFLGYSGWGEGQLDQELAEESWITRVGQDKLIFATRPDAIWSEALRALGGVYRFYAEMPHDPSMN